MLHTGPLAIAPDPHRLFVLRRLGLVVVVRVERALVLLGVGEKCRVCPLVVVPDAVGRLNALNRGIRLVQQHQQSAKLALIAGRTVRHLGHGDQSRRRAV